jgi:hypothetical protein
MWTSRLTSIEESTTIIKFTLQNIEDDYVGFHRNNLRTTHHGVKKNQ